MKVKLEAQREEAKGGKIPITQRIATRTAEEW
jgi:hypothetical protein